MFHADKPLLLKRWAARVAMCAGFAAAWPAAHADTVELTPGRIVFFDWGSFPPNALILDEALLRWDLSNGQNPADWESFSAGRRLSSVGGAVVALNVMKASVEPTGLAQVNQSLWTVGINGRQSQTRALIGVQAPVQELAFDRLADNKSLLSVKSMGGLSLTSPEDLPRGALGGTLTIENLRVDMRNATIHGRVSGKSLDSPDASVFEDMALFTFGGSSGVKGFVDTFDAATVWGLGWQAGSATTPDLGRLAKDGWQVEATTATTIAAKGELELSDLRLTDEGFQVFVDSLGLIEGGAGYNVLAGVNALPRAWGSMHMGLAVRLTNNYTFSPSQPFDLPPVRLVPEPSSYALMGLGLVGLVWVRRRQRLVGIR